MTIQGIINGKKIAKEIRMELKDQVLRLQEIGLTPSLAIILIGNHTASEIYVRGKMRASHEVGIASELFRFTPDITEEKLLSVIHQLNQDPSVHGILVQLPLPDHISTSKVVETISPKKDVDGFHPYNVGRLVIGYPSILPCTPRGIMELLHRSNITMEGKHAVVVGRSNIVGKPIALLLQRAHATVTMCHSRTPHLSHYVRKADILVTAVGQSNLIGAEDVKKGAVIIDVGMNRNDAGELVGDVHFEGVAPLVQAITPVPGGVGPMTIAMLLSNTIEVAKESTKKGELFDDK